MGFTYGTNSRELFIDNRSGDTRADIVFRTKESGVPEERFRIDSTGLIHAKTRSAEVRRMILSGSPTNTAFNIEAHDGETGTSSGDVQGKLGLFYNDGTTLNNTANISFERGSGAADGAMAFVTNQTERLRISSDGKVGIGTDSSGTGGNLGKLNVVVPTTSGASALQIMNSAVGGADGSLTNIVLRSVNNTGSNWAHAQYLSLIHI